MKKAAFGIIILCFASCTSNKRQPIDERNFITLGGEEQYIEITGVSDKYPILLFLHGGPGWPQTPHLRYFNNALTQSVVLVSWDQRGCGKSYMKNPDPKNLTKEQIVNDAHELILLLKKRFNKDKIYVAGFSWGSVIGLELVQQYPEDYAAYFAISQVIDIQRSIDLSREWIKRQAALKKDDSMLKMVSRLEKKDSSYCKTELDCFFKKYEMLTAYGGAIYKKKSEAQIKIAETKYEDYKNYDWIKGFMYSCSRLGNEVFKTDLAGINELKVPAYFFVGRHDWSLPAVVTEKFVSNLKAPKKEIIWFEESGHEPLEEESSKFNKEIIDRMKDEQ